MSSNNVVSAHPDTKIRCCCTGLASIGSPVDIRVYVDAYIDSALCEHNLGTNMAVVSVSTMQGRCTESD